MIRGGIVMFMKIRQLTKLNLLVTISVCASTFIGAGFVYSVWNWLVPEFLQLPTISFANCVSVITTLADLCMLEVQIMYKFMEKKDKKKQQKPKRKRR